MSRRNFTATQKPSATNAANLRTFLLMEQFAAKEIGGRIAQARRERGLTQEQLAGMCSFSERSLQDYEAGTTIPYKHLTELGAILGRKTEWFLHGDEQASPDVEERLERIEAQLAKIHGLVARFAPPDTADPPAISEADS